MPGGPEPPPPLDTRLMIECFNSEIKILTFVRLIRIFYSDDSHPVINLDNLPVR